MSGVVSALLSSLLYWLDWAGPSPRSQSVCSAPSGHNVGEKCFLAKTRIQDWHQGETFNTIKRNMLILLPLTLQIITIGKISDGHYNKKDKKSSLIARYSLRPSPWSKSRLFPRKI